MLVNNTHYLDVYTHESAVFCLREVMGDMIK